MTLPFKAVVTETTDQLFRVHQAAEKKTRKVAPSGEDRVSPAELRKRWPHMGDEARAKVRLSLAKPGDEQGINALMELLNDG